MTNYNKGCDCAQERQLAPRKAGCQVTRSSPGSHGAWLGQHHHSAPGNRLGELDDYPRPTQLSGKRQPELRFATPPSLCVFTLVASLLGATFK